MEEKNDLINETSPPINQLKAVDDVKIEEALQTGYAAYAEEAQTDIEQETEANSTGYVLTDEVAMLDDSTGYVVQEEYLTEPEEKDEFEVGVANGTRKASTHCRCMYRKPRCGDGISRWPSGL